MVASGVHQPPHALSGGALVHERVVMMAANCLLDDMDWAPENKVFAEIRIGLDKNEGGQYEVRHAKWAVVHPGMTSSWNFMGVSDIALVLLDRPSTMRPLLHLPPEWFKWDWQFCAGRPSKGVNPCSGDNGFPLIWKGPTGDVAVGVTTRSGAGCGGWPNVYADVAVASNWIRNTIQWMVHEDAAGRIPGPATG
ncbi:hypothetical protein C2E21_1735 [Chlorella sorokiniana]|uniref:Peptidase S1 domain-containing protein n=1 Tax=Chlorella sorokiniana TaxID=3076 RepID=A0A2P6U1H1_CHLSO|nr:hypothetical protein C2E21_1735 [Chlorella sorokiniana]|eukprot:PRW60162.1 hypothetical protein C2E21_1735 [Chlorella sorokiniana]